MPTVEVTIRGRRHTIQCGEGEELRVRRLAQYLDGRLSELAREHGNVGDSRLLLLVALLLADELDDAYAALQELRQRGPGGATGGGDDQVVEALERIAGRIERLAGAGGMA